jgi:DNA-binding LytR/AlgR family response regulator
VNNSIFIDIGHQLRKVDLEQVIHLYYVDGATTIEMSHDTKVVCCTTLKELFQHLPHYFLRINRNVIINVKYITAYYKLSQSVSMSNGRNFIVTRRNVTQLVSQMKSQFTLVK